MNLLHLFITGSIFIALLLILYLITEANTTKSSYGIRKKKQLEYNYGLEYSLWFLKREQDLKRIYKEEYCDSMTLGFEEFCIRLFHGGGIIYEG